MVEIKKNAERVRGLRVKKRAVGSGFGAIPIHFYIRKLVIGLVQYHIQHHRNSVQVGRVDQAFQVVFGAISFVGGEIKNGIVAPGVVARKLHDRHNFDAVDAQAFQVG